MRYKTTAVAAALTLALVPAARAAGPLDGVAQLLNAGSQAAAPLLDAVTPFAGVPGNMNAPDLNGDGRADIAVPDFGTDFLSVRINRGNGTFGPLRRYKTGVKPSFITRGDFNGDGHVDPATSNALSADISVLLGNGDGTLKPAKRYSISSDRSHSNGSFSLDAVDVDGDGELDIVTSNSITDDLSVLHGRGDGTFAPAKSFAIGGPHSIGIIPFALSVGDLDGDGDIDAVTGGATSTTIMLNDGHGNFTAMSSNTVGLDIACTKLGDFDEDGDLDFAATGTGTLNAQVLLNRGDGSFAPGDNLFSLGIGPQCYSLADFNGDGHLDISLVNSSSLVARGVVAIMLGDGHGHFRGNLLKTSYPVNLAPWATDVADFDGDGRLDLAVANSAPASVSILNGHGDGTFAKQVSYGM